MSISRFPAIVDEVTVRLIAAVVLALGVIAVATQQWWVYAVLALDFTLRAVIGPQVSPIARAVQTWLRPRLATPNRPTAGAPKRFAAAIGAVMTGAATTLWVVNLTTGSAAALTAVVVIAAIMVLFPALEAILGLCVGCKLFAGLMRLGLVPEEICLDCADITRRQRLQPVA